MQPAALHIGGSYVYPMQLNQGRLKCSKAMCGHCTASLGISFHGAAEGETADVSEWLGKHCLSSACVKKFPPGMGEVVICAMLTRMSPRQRQMKKLPVPVSTLEGTI
jgi:hypothetical protein